DIRNNADNLVYSTEKSLRDVGDKLSAEDRGKIEAAVSETKEALKGTDIEKIRATSKSLMQASHKLAEQVYAAQATQTQGQAGGQSKEGEKVVDAEVTEEKDENSEETK
ncbi:MAG TPA: Hsp70 family protein, partial [Candidatus Subteraquimicrobiales bacterium]